MKIREAVEDDLKELSLLFDAYRVFYRQSSNIEGARDFIKDRLTFQDSKIFVAEEQDTLLGFVQLYPRFSSTQLKRTWLLNDLFVSPEARGKQLGVRLIERAKVLAVTTNSVGLMLETEKSNTIGNNLYPKTDFILDKLHNFYYWEFKK
ncbi:GNAT family N-acetyltransferase [Gillisia marina]|uniref:GNAT family N-acetyltransferase n=1 Tax=Gillisia marina TaxID=1167637 RepID=UPI000299FCEB|nr:GNAT family N-acetyltransferase [Gillisia marina]